MGGNPRVNPGTVEKRARRRRAARGDTSETQQNVLWPLQHINDPGQTHPQYKADFELKLRDVGGGVEQMMLSLFLTAFHLADSPERRRPWKGNKKSPENHKLQH